MGLNRCIAVLLGGCVVSAAVNSSSQIVINELVINDRNYAGNVTDSGEFVELYNAGNAPVDLTNWVIATKTLANGNSTSHTITSGTINPGDYFVVGMTGVPNLDYDLGLTPLWTDGAARILQLQNPSATIIDAVAYEVWRNGATGLTAATADQQAQVGSGFQGQLFSFVDAFFPNERTTWSRFRDGRDTNSNGRDFGILPATPGTSNNLPLNFKHSVPNVDASGVSTGVEQYNASFVIPTVINPEVIDGNNPRAIPQSPQGGNAIIAWDPLGGGNTAYSEELVHGFDIFAYFDTTPLGISQFTGGQEYEISAYGIGTSDARFAIANPLGVVTGTGTPITENASTGLGWFYQRWENTSSNSVKLLLIDFGDGGSSSPGDNQWQIKQEIDVTSKAPGWYRLAIDYDPNTGDVMARFDDQAFSFTSAADQLGTFYVGYREVISNHFGFLDRVNPPVFDIYSPPGDYDRDGDVDPDDYAMWRSTFGDSASPTGAGADGNRDGTINAADYVIWRDHLASPTPIGSGQTAVPEPSTWIMEMLALFTVASWRRFQRG